MESSLPRLVQDIQSQPLSLQRVLLHHCGKGSEQLLRSAELVRSAKRVVIAGIGASLNASILLENLLSTNGVDAIALEAGELFHYRTDAYRDAVFIIVSRSGESIEIARLSHALRERNPVIAVTNEPDSTLAGAAKFSIDVHSMPDEMVAIQSYTGTLLSLFLLGMAVLNRLEEARKQVDALLPKLSRWIEVNLDRNQDWDTFLEPNTPVYSLGRGPSYGTALQSALLFSEIAKAPAIGMAVASFRHGPVEVVDEGFKGLIFAPRGRTFRLNVSLAQDLTKFGGHVRVIGPVPEDSLGLNWIHTPMTSELLAPLSEILPVQMAALRLAQLRGIPVGKFRFAPQVARDEARLPA